MTEAQVFATALVLTNVVKKIYRKQLIKNLTKDPFNKPYVDFSKKYFLKEL